MNDEDKSTLGDCCQKHDPMTAPVVYPYKITKDTARDGTVSLRAEYRCACGNDWSCWWNAWCAGWTDEDIEAVNQATARADAGAVQAEWFHRGPCHRCSTCGGNGCYASSDGLNPELHICANGCDGLPPGLESAA
jgi:hypothetical protein